TAPGAPAVVVIEGETGMGKTRLAEEFLRRLAMSPGPPLLLRASGRRPQPLAAYEGARALLGRLHLSPGIGGASPSTLAVLRELVPGLRERFPTLVEHPDARGLPPALADALDAVGEERPLLILLDD